MNHLSQSSLQDFVDCPRRFQLRHVERRVWPALESQPAQEHERLMLRGSLFHRLAQQYFLGIPAETLTRQAAADPDLTRWWQAFLAQPQFASWKEQNPAVEISLSAPFHGYRLVSKFDLLRIQTDGQMQIYDWKTSLKYPRREWLADRVQTRLYPYLLARAGTALNQGRPPQPQQIEMVYWFPEFPDRPLHFPYSETQFSEDEAYLRRLIEMIAALGNAPAPLTDDERHCRYCVYRSLCDRGAQAGPLAEAEADWQPAEGFDFDLDFEQVAEVAF